MKNRPEILSSEIELTEDKKALVKENSDLDYWSKEYDISAEDLKNKGYNKGVYDKIVESYMQHAH
jgi:hypothetical protein